jgi:hypothetical protein
MAWVGCAADLMAALKTDAIATVLIVAFPLRLALIARCAGLRLSRGERLAAILPSWLAFLGDESAERRLARGLGLSVFVDALLVGLWPVWRQAALDVGAVVTNPQARAQIAMLLGDWKMIAHG